MRHCLAFGGDDNRRIGFEHIPLPVMAVNIDIKNYLGAELAETKDSWFVGRELVLDKYRNGLARHAMETINCSQRLPQ